jgi:hypothetical protein
MRIPKLSGSGKRTLIRFLVPFTVTYAVGLAALILYLRSTSDGPVTILPARASGEEAVNEPAVGDVTETTQTSEPANRDRSDSNALAAASRNDFTTDYRNNDQSSPQPAASDRDSADRSVTSPPPGSSGSDMAATNQNGLSAIASSGSLTNVSPADIAAQNSAPNATTTSATEPNNGLSEYPARRIPWHDGFTLEQEWYRSWYGWAAFNGPQTDAANQGN